MVGVNSKRTSPAQNCLPGLPSAVKAEPIPLPPMLCIGRPRHFPSYPATLLPPLTCKSEADTPSNGLCGVPRVEEAVWVRHHAHVQQHLGLCEVLHLRG